jgi:small subunit ribosomal protein S9
MEKYTYTKGRRKTSAATIRLFDGKGDNLVNDKPVNKYFEYVGYQQNAVEPLKLVNAFDKYYFTAKVKGGGMKGQAGAVVHALARALAKQDPEYKDILKKALMMRRDDRMVERKKTGLRKARKAPQFSKR